MSSAFGICAQQFANGDQAEATRLANMQLIDQEIDQCYTKCIWEESGQYDAVNNIIDVSAIINGLIEKNVEVPQHLIDLGEPTDGSCKAIFDKTRAFVQAQHSS